MAVTMKTALAGLALIAAALAGAPAAWAGNDGPVTKTMNVRAAASGPASEELVLGLNKAAIIELPSDAVDVLVSNPAIVDAIVRTPRRIYILGLSVGQTNAFFFAENGRQILNLEIRVERDTVSLAELLRRHLPDARIKVEAINDNIVLSGTVPSAAMSEQAKEIAVRFAGGKPENVVNMLTISGREQVMIRVRVAEMQRTVAKQLGIDLAAMANVGGVPVQIFSQNQFGLLGRALGAGAGTVGLLPKTAFDPTRPVLDGDPVPPYTPDPRDLRDQGFNNVAGTIRALERAGVMRLLAEPNLTAISGEAANFLAGGSFPVPKSVDDKGNVVVEYEPYGIGLAFTPVVLSEGRISLRVSTEVSELTNEGAFTLNGGTTRNPDGTVTTLQGLTLPGLRIRRAETTVEIPSGGSLMMAGLLREESKQSVDGYPGMKDLPVLGALFRSRDFMSNQTELVVIVTAYLVDPVTGRELALPTEGYVPASDAEAILLGRSNTPHAPAEGAGQAGGYIIE